MKNFMSPKLFDIIYTCPAPLIVADQDWLDLKSKNHTADTWLLFESRPPANRCEQLFYRQLVLAEGEIAVVR